MNETARDRIAGLNEGADDYLPKPFEIDELVARLTAVRRRTSVMVEDKRLAVGNFAYDPISRDVTAGDAKLSLARRELVILELLLRNRGRTVLRSSLEDNVYSYDDVNRAGFPEGSNFQVGWSHDEQNDEQVFS